MELNEFGGTSVGAPTGVKRFCIDATKGSIRGDVTTSAEAAPSGARLMTPFEDAKAKLQLEIEGFGDGEVDRFTVLAKADEIARQSNGNVRAADLRGWAKEQLKMLQTGTLGSSGTGARGCANARAGELAPANAALASLLGVVPAIDTGAAPPLCKGAPLTMMPQFMTEEEAERQLNARMLKVGDWGGSPCFGRFRPDGSVVRLRAEDLNTFLSGHFVTLPDSKGGVRQIPAAVWWTQSASKVVFDVVRYDPEHKYTQPGEQVLNTWRGFAVQPAKGTWTRMRRHIWQVLCRGDKAAFKYLIRWMAHLVQHPGY